MYIYVMLVVTEWFIYNGYSGWSIYGASIASIAARFQVIGCPRRVLLFNGSSSCSDDEINFQ